jgi:Skp family chaperone for outer membrane proteins
VRRSHGWAALAIVLSLSSLLAIAVAQNAGVRSTQPMPGSRVALIDINYLFKSHAGFNSRMEEWKRAFNAANEDFKQKRNAIAKDIEALQLLNKASPDYAQKERAVADRDAQLRVDATLSQNKFVQLEATIHYEVYQEIMQATDYFCRENNIDVVLRFNRDKTDPQRPDSILSLINRQVVWTNQGIDVTEHVLRDLNRRSPAPAADGRNGAAPRAAIPFEGPAGTYPR